MAYVLPEDIELWIVGEVETGRYASIREVLEAAIDALLKRHEEEDWLAIKEALDGIELGTDAGRPAEEVFRRLREEHNLPERES